ncbi:MAG: basic rane protein [Solirubrobacteraceae bacterium]|nr:basic rane protein [Solirubrobacteraceae bacterium]
MHQQAGTVARPTWRQRRVRHTIITVLAIGIGSLAVAACGSSGSDSGSAASSGDAAEGKQVKVGVLIPGFPKDGGFMESAANGVARAKSQLGGKVTIKSITQVPSADMQQALTQLASTSDLVISIGGQTDEALRQVVKSFPSKKFVEVGGPPDALGNLAMYDPKQAEIAFVAGALAALTSKTGSVQFLAGVEIPPIVNTANEFAKGAKYAKPSITVLPPGYTGDFEDVSKAKEAALAGIARGADVQYQILNTGLKGMLQAAHEKGTKVIGGPLTHDCGFDPAFAGYTKSDIGFAAEYAMKQVLDGTWNAKYVPFGLKSSTGASDIVACTDNGSVKSRLSQIMDDIRAGKIKTV